MSKLAHSSYYLEYKQTLELLTRAHMALVNCATCLNLERSKGDPTEISTLDLIRDLNDLLGGASARLYAPLPDSLPDADVFGRRRWEADDDNVWEDPEMGAQG